VLRPTAEDRFIGSPPIAFVFGLGGLVLFPLRVGACSILLKRASTDELLPAISKWGATVLFTVPTAYRAMLPLLGNPPILSHKC
jgi:2-aminobenzoate-CoA ligase